MTEPINLFRVPEQYRFTDRGHVMGSTEKAGNNGVFSIPLNHSVKRSLVAKCIVSDGADWEHVSVTLNRSRTLTWAEMCFIKSMFWDDAATVLQYHPAGADYVNVHEYCLHLWRPVGYNPELPPEWCV